MPRTRSPLRVRKYRTFDTKRDATRAFNEHKVKMDKGTQIMPSEYTFAQWLDYWYKDIILPQIEETTAYGYRGMIENYLKPQLGEIRLQKLTARDIQQYYTWLMDEKELSPNTVIKHHNLLTNTLNAAERQEYITKNPMRAVSPPKKRQREAKFYTPEQLGILLDKAVGTRLELPVFICAYLGLRRGELCGLRWSDVDLEHKTITIENTRTQAGKKEIEKLIDTAEMTPLVHVSGMLGNYRGNCVWVAPLAWHPTNQNAVIVCDLSGDIDNLLSKSAVDLRQDLYTKKSELEERGVYKWQKKIKPLTKAAKKENAGGACLQDAPKVTRKNARQKSISTEKKKVKNLPTTRQVFAPVIYNVRATIADCTSTKRRSTKAKAKKKQQEFPEKSEAKKQITRRNKKSNCST